MENKLHVSDLTISFRTTSGKVQAVRGIDFDLQKGETLAIVGESGSGKSVTSKAILGILAGNAIIEGGEIIYDGSDLLRISEEDFHKIRGDKIAMIFQDPMSSLNPIVKIGRQLTEAMVLKGKARQRESRVNFNTYLKNLKCSMKDAGVDSVMVDALCAKFEKLEAKHIALENDFMFAYDAAVECEDSIADLAFELEKNAVKDMNYRLKQVVKQSNAAIHTYVVNAKADQLKQLTNGLVKRAGECKKQGGDYTEIIERLRAIEAILEEAIAYEKPNYLAMGYYLTYVDKELPKAASVAELNKRLQERLDNDFLNEFLSLAEKGVRYSAEAAYDKRVKAIDELNANLHVFEAEKLDKAESRAVAQKLIAAVNDTINRLELTKDSLIYTFASGINKELDTYFTGINKNVKEQSKHDRMQAKHDKMIARGKTPDWTVPAAAITDLELTKRNICHQITRLVEHYRQDAEKRRERDYTKETIALIEYLRTCASGTVNKVTQQIAKARAIKLMEEVGIAEPRKRYNQYPFEFSGGMRQRIVIAIALAADPDILICDEPTTALDVTIQSQILELINRLKAERQLSVIFITHDLGVVANMADRIAVMYAGKIVEYGTSQEVFYQPAHPYTWALLSSMPDLDTNERLESIPGTPPNMIYPPKGDAFAPRNRYAMKIDFERQPPMFKITDTHYAATWLLHPDAPKVETPKVITDRIERMKSKREAQYGK